jgi:hypothetical protein
MKWGVPFTGLKFVRDTHSDNHVLNSNTSSEDELPLVPRLTNAVPSVLVMLRSDVHSQLDIANFASCALDFIENDLKLKCGAAIHDGNRAEVNAFRFEGADTLKDVYERKYDLPFDLLCLCHLIHLSFGRAKRRNRWLKLVVRNLKEICGICRTSATKKRPVDKVPKVQEKQMVQHNSDHNLGLC